MILFTTVDDRVDLLPFFIHYYARLGADRIVVGVWNGTDNSSYPKLKAHAQAAPSGCVVELIESIRCDYDHYSGVAETPWLNKMRLELVPEGEWYSVADLDEFYDFTGGKFDRLRACTESKECHAVSGGFGMAFIDRIAKDFPSLPAFGEATLDATFPLACCLSQAMGCGTTKIIMARNDVPIIPGHHYTFGHPVLERFADVHHFKWSASVASLLMRRHLSYHRQALAHAGESSRFVEFFIKNPDWRNDPTLAVREAHHIGV